MTPSDTKRIVVLVACLLGRPVSRLPNGHEDTLDAANVEQAYFCMIMPLPLIFFSSTICSRPSCFLISAFVLSLS
jgi:hypothetical protein